MHSRNANSAIISTNQYNQQFQNSMSQSGISENQQSLPRQYRSNSFYLFEETQGINRTGSILRSDSSLDENEGEVIFRTERRTSNLNFTPIDDMIFKSREPIQYNQIQAGFQEYESYVWEKVESKGSQRPCPRSSSASVIYKECLYLFGGFTFNGRLNEIYQFNFKTLKWTKIKATGTKPSARENNGAVVYQNKLYIYGGYDGVSWFKDFYSFDFATYEWTRLPIQGDEPTQSFGFASGSHENSFAIFGGFEGQNWLNDYFEYNFTTSKWKKVELKGSVPSERSCPSYCSKDEYLYVFGGYNGIDKLQDFYRINMKKGKSIFIQQKGSIPSPRYFHSQIYYSDKIFLFGGYNGQVRLNDLYEFNVNTNKWTKIDQKDPPAGRSSMVLQIYNDVLFLFGGLIGFNVMNDFYQFKFQTACLPKPQLNQDIFSLLNNQQLSDVQFLVEGQIIYANKAILSCRSEYFRMMFTNGLQENCQQQSQQPVVIKDTSYDSFVDVLVYIYTDTIDNNLSPQRIIALLQLSDLYFLDRLKYLCEEKLVRTAQEKNIIDYLLLSQKNRCSYLKKYCMAQILDNLNEIKQQPCFQKLLIDPTLLMEIIMNKN
ncbi:kelch motif protein (macronuclear) [Tetrahymena thermophila SB210]|uniref:Kelch motif protein n=1 Tax=Tetrahymena thermophila (strain SB210) TaxID=312017 RepID=Q22M44_TETTS|nr:kelch motif protein [Tetrahymena thermophila SB210]EAR86286.2 kelch motif protein [Tetrahymena thermophila SB210]|eukprot:XP_977176.2 kelch motif protein [Tetrahymena thermophila SB210]